MDYPLWTLGRNGLRLVDLMRKTNSLRLYPELLESQYLEPSVLRERQWEALLRLVEHAVAKVPYYRRIFAERGLRAESIQCPEDLGQLPILNKEIIRAEGDDLLAADFKAWQPRPKATSGSTGVPLRYYIDRRSHSHHWAFIWRAWQQCGFTPGDSWTTLSGGALVPAKVDFRQKTYLWLNGAIHQPSYHLRDEDLRAYADLLARKRFSLLYAYPSSLRLFARWLGENGRGIEVDRFFTTSELLPEAWRLEIERNTGGSIRDIYGNNDGGILSFECEERGGYHYNMEGVFLEVVDADGRQLPPGEAGEIISTNLLNYAMPFIRYAPGDSGSLSAAACPCGRGLDRIEQLQGRVRDVIIAADGRRVHGAFFNHFEPFYEADWLEAFQVRQKRRGELRLILQPRRAPSEQERDLLLLELRRGLGEDMQIDLEFVDRIERSAAGKYRLIVSDVSD